MLMSSHRIAPAKQPIRAAVFAAALVVAGCFTAAFTFAEQPANAESQVR